VSERSLARRTLDALVYAPAGLLLTAVEDLPSMAAKGRSRIEVQVRNAHLVGRMVVTLGRHDLERRVADLADLPGRDAPSPPPTPSPSPAAPPQPAGRGTATGLAIPDYDTLSASQVVRRLDGLGRPELEAVVRHEAATRGRRTILHRAQQLLGSEDPPGP
jgi:hypothetical protein